MILRNPQLLALLLILPVVVLLWRWRGVRVPATALLLRLLALAAVVVALTDPLLSHEQPSEGPLVVLVDQSASLTPATQAALRSQAADLVASDPAAQVLYFGAEVLSGPPASGSEEQAATHMPDPDGSELGAGLRTARALLPGGGRVVLLSDGYDTGGTALAEAHLAAAAGLRVDVAPVRPASRSEAALIELQVPTSLRVGEEFPITIVTHVTADPTSDTTLAGHLRLWEGTTLLADEQVQLQPGEESFRFRHRAANPGVLQLRAELAMASGDTFGENNAIAATSVVNPPPRVLLVARTESEATLLGQALERQGLTTQIVAAPSLPGRLADLATYDGMVLVDVPATSLSLDQMATVREFVRSEGRGLVVLGGRNAYTLGGYKATPLEEVLPVLMEPPPRPERTEVALLLIVDRSASMTAAFGVSKFDMAKEAAILASESLRPGDRIGILAFDTGTLWVINFQLLDERGSLAAIQQAVLDLPSGGGTEIEYALREGLPALALQPTGVRHAVLLTDGRSFTNDYRAYQDLVATAQANSITLSTIAIGEDSDVTLLEQLARWGGGRYYYADQPEDIPRLTLLESAIARADLVVEGTMRVGLNQPHPIMRDFAPVELPPLQGYIATQPRPGAEVVLRAPEEDPLLAVWQYGLGRSIAWTSSSADPWAGDWAAWGGFERFWAQAVRYTLPEPESGPLQVRLEPRPDGAHLLVDVLQPGGLPLDLASVNARITLPDGSQRSVDLGQVAPGRYAQDLTALAPGAYALSVVVLQDGALLERQVGYVQPVPAEYYAPTDPASGLALLTAISEVTGGTLLAEVLPQAAEAPPPAAEPVSLWPWLLGLALALWVLEIAVRRGVFVRGWSA